VITARCISACSVYDPQGVSGEEVADDLTL
jgi:hypothetical protein